MKTKRLHVLGPMGLLLVVATVAHAQQAILVGSAGGVDVWSVPDANSPAGTLATNIRLTSAEGTKLVTFENVAIRGGVQQVWDSVVNAPTAQGPPQPSTLYHASWVPSDSHLLITAAMVGGQAGGGYIGISEDNDGSLTTAGHPLIDGGFNPLVGLGDIAMDSPSDAFFLDTPFQTNSVDFARIVVPEAMVAHGFELENVTLTLGVLGEGIINSGEDGGAFFENLPVLLPEPASGAFVLLFVCGLTIMRRRHSERCQLGYDHIGTNRHPIASE